MNTGDKRIGDRTDEKEPPRPVIYKGMSDRQYIDTGRRMVAGIISAGPISGKSMHTISIRVQRPFRSDRLFIEPRNARFFSISARVGICSQEISSDMVPASFYAVKKGVPVDYEVCDIGSNLSLVVVNQGQKPHWFEAAIEGSVLEEYFDRPGARAFR